MAFLRAALVLSLLAGVAGCHQGPSASASSHALPVIPVPHNVHRLAVLYPQSPTEWTQAYRRLEAATFHLRNHRPALTIVDRLNLPILLAEQRFQHTGIVEDNNAIHIGRLLGVDSVLIYRIDGPSFGDRVWARQAGDLPPIMVTSKLIRVENAEVLYHRVVVAEMEPSSAGDWSMAENLNAQRLSRDALERGIAQTVAELRRAFD